MLEDSSKKGFPTKKKKKSRVARARDVHKIKSLGICPVVSARSSRETSSSVAALAIAAFRASICAGVGAVVGAASGSIVESTGCSTTPGTYVLLLASAFFKFDDTLDKTRPT